jgi:hypothetical protein
MEIESINSNYKTAEQILNDLEVNEKKFEKLDKMEETLKEIMEMIKRNPASNTKESNRWSLPIVMQENWMLN